MMELNNFLFVAGKISVNLFIVWGIWFMALRKLNQFSLVRFFLMLGVICSFLLPYILPLIPFSLAKPMSDGDYFFSFLLPEVVVKQTSSTNSISVLPVVFVSISAFFMVRLILQLFKMTSLLVKGQRRRDSGLLIVEHSKPLGPFSFLNFCFINPTSIPEEKLRSVLLHERAHSRLAHSSDLIILELLGIIQWFNPFYWLIRKTLVELHEYQADSEVIKQQLDPYAYQDTIVSLALGGVALPLGNNFSKSLTLKRLAMMNIKKKTKGAYGRWILALMVAVPLLFAVSCSESKNDNLFTSDNADMDLRDNEVINENEDIFVIVEQMPKFNGKDATEFRSFIAENIRYPQIAWENGIQGRVWISFIVENTGEVSNVKVVRGVDPSLDREAVKVIESSPRWEPGKQKGQKVRVSFTFPVSFVLAEDSVPTVEAGSLPTIVIRD